MKGLARWVTFLAVVCLSVVINTYLVMAGEGTGSGSGGGQTSALSLTTSNPVDGQKDFKSSGEIVLTFSKNVVNASVRDKNKTQFSLTSADGIKVPIDVRMADDQMEPEKNETVILKSLQELKFSTEYTLIIAPELQSKSGVTLGKPVTIKFATANGIGSANTLVDKNSSTSTTSTKQEHNDNWGLIITIGLIIIGLGGVTWYFYSRRKN